MDKQLTPEQRKLANLIEDIDEDGIEQFVKDNLTKLVSAPNPGLPLYTILDVVDDETDEAKLKILANVTEFLILNGIREKPDSIYSPLLAIAQDIPDDRFLPIAKVLLTNAPQGQDPAMEAYGPSKNIYLLKEAIKKQNTKLADLLLRITGAFLVDYPPNNPPIFDAVRTGEPEIVDVILKYGANVNVKNADGDTPLHVALDAPNLKVIEKLIEKKANKNVKNSEGETPYDLALITPDVTQYILLLLKPEVGLVPPAPTPGVTIAPPPPPAQSFAFQPAPVTSMEAKPTPVPKIAPEEYIPNAMQLKGFEVRAFESEHGVIPVYITTLPRGTMLFRGIRDERQIRNDILGMNVKETEYDEDGVELGSVENPDMYCLSPHYNVFFYPFPFVDATVGKFENVVVYVVKDDLKVACFISPTPMARADRSIRGMPIVSCNALNEFEQGCSEEGMVGREYDPCFNHAFLTKNPDVVGMIAIAGTDRAAFARSATDSKTSIYAHYNVHYSTYVDSHSIVPGIPEIILHPRIIRKTETITTAYGTENHLTEEKTYYPRSRPITDWLKDARNKDTIPYAVFHAFSGRDETEIEAFMTAITSPDGWREKYAQIDKTTGFYVLSNFADDPSTLLPAEEIGRMAESFPELMFTRARVLPGSRPIGSGRRTRRRAH